ncbi:mannose-6-phosphate isomerase, class I [Propionicimonas sp.]|uniref:mannose-6-phosphate isomerase, class I n=1 Tax=Propionicimonas sp. TaxID=1955623 RepID=UPI001857D629|nr:mannose-6-phosphate isomerase, class I [Propionicimonas sp.]MBU3975415.1 mannose-6-phosphate isomerase, class I [Actinomycetota bacterium]MBA3020179.1 mannose-6-phosphate isomerase, class I [Propionicimonas sp.]MBU3986436.1 mannose-6-phosphate isomerase, class I [Actinomycetota bacterium]MBU4008005.1 mannose-6-phosphate isomerase, class I [Actinomycetota bacterium]MBU4064263.1 mannose-6-phosphate isomerase, class I [Actinomycetota bacterium]
MLRLQGAVQRYAWGTTDAIPKILGRTGDDTPLAEYWLGAHPSAPSRVNGQPLNEYLDQNPQVIGGPSRARFGDQLPYLVKVLSARHALSLQAHPSRAQAEDGFAREEAAGVALDAPERTYRDSWPKPEILIALDEFHTLSGFRDPRRTEALFAGLGVADDLASVIGPLTERRGAAALEEVFLDVLSLTGERARVSELVCAAAMKHKDDAGELGQFARTVIELDEVFPADPGILAALLMNRVVLHPGEAMFVPAGHMHAHLRGTGVEVMANSDNVIRGGLTPKHVDVSELIRVVEFEPSESEVMKPQRVGDGVDYYPTSCPEFDVWRVTAGAEVTSVDLPGIGSARVLLIISGSATLSAGDQTLELAQGEAALIDADEEPILTGTATGFLTAAGER